MQPRWPRAATDNHVTTIHDTALSMGPVTAITSLVLANPTAFSNASSIGGIPIATVIYLLHLFKLMQLMFNIAR